MQSKRDKIGNGFLPEEPGGKALSWAQLPPWAESSKKRSEAVSLHSINICTWYSYDSRKIFKQESNALMRLRSRHLHEVRSAEHFQQRALPCLALRWRFYIKLHLSAQYSPDSLFLTRIPKKMSWELWPMNAAKAHPGQDWQLLLSLGEIIIVKCFET